MIGSQDLLIGLAIMLVLFGAKRVPELARSLGQSIKEFKKGTLDEERPPAEPPPAAAACGACRSPLQPDWTHCPRCGTAAPPPPGPKPS